MVNFDTYTIPAPLLPVVSALGVQWPDINELDVWDLGDDLLAFGDAINDVGLVVGRHLADLSHENSAALLKQLESYWQELQAGYLESAVALIAEASRFCHDGYDAIHVYKAMLLAYLDVEVGAIVASGGVAALVDVVGENVIRAAVQQMAQQVEMQILDVLLRPLEQIVMGGLHDLVRRAIKRLEAVAYRGVAKDLPSLNLTSLEDKLVISAESLAAAVEKIKGRMHDVDKAASTLESAHLVKGYHHAAPVMADHTLRQQITGFLSSFIPDVIAGVEELCARLIEHVTGIVVVFASAVDTADQALAARAAGSGGP